jgi:signal transduction histidine kinase
MQAHGVMQGSGPSALPCLPTGGPKPAGVSVSATAEGASSEDTDEGASPPDHAGDSLDTRMAIVLSEFARTLATEFTIPDIIEHLVHQVVRVLPVDSAGVTLMAPDSAPEFVAASDGSALRFERLQTEIGEGPCLAAYEGNQAISIADLRADPRFPRFAERALEEGMVAVFTFPLRDGESGLGALDLYRESAGPLLEAEMAAAQTLADVATVYLLNAQARIDLKTVSATERDALEQLRLVDQKKTEYLTAVIHELRTPMTSITGYTELLQDADAGGLSATQQRLLDAIDRNGQRLTALADDLLTLAELEEGAVVDKHVEVDLCAVVLAAQSAVEGRIDGRRLQVEFEVPAGPVTIDGEARSLERLTTNLLTNAVKFTPDGGLVRCTLRQVDETAFIEVTDTGIGIPEAEQGELFTRFFRARAVEQGDIPGSGLGLNIVASIAHNHGGKVSVESTPGRGTTFVVELPLR